MPSFQWDENFVTGLAEVDEQHLYLVDRINRFGELVSENISTLDDLNKLFKELSEYAVYHFNEEQSMMLSVGIDSRHFDKHIETHNDFLQEVTSMYEAVSGGTTVAIELLLDFLIHWLAYHILGTDQNMSRQVASIKSGLSPSEAYEKEERVADSATKPLLETLNRMFHQVSSRNKDLLKLNQTLEAKVEERTKALKAVIDTYGHDAGDVVLTELAKALQHSFRTDDIVCRLGGDEFLVLCPNTDHDGSMYIAEVVLETVSGLKVPTGGSFWNSSISVGVATRVGSMNNYEDLIKLADKGVYAAKQDGKNCIRSMATL